MRHRSLCVSVCSRFGKLWVDSQKVSKICPSLVSALVFEVMLHFKLENCRKTQNFE